MHLNDLIEHLSLDEICFWTGAGISFDPPSNLPLGLDLTKNVVNVFCIEKTWEELCYYIKKACIYDSLGNQKYFPRLEAVLDSLVNIYGHFALSYLSILKAPPNKLHNFFATHLQLGGNHITMNIDNCIQLACDLLKNKYPYFFKNNVNVYDDYNSLSKLEQLPNSCLIHLHGRFLEDNTDNLNKLGVTIKSISFGIPDKIKNILFNILNSKRFLIFCGYSGCDFFDINPFFQELSEIRDSFCGLKVIWVRHDHYNSNGKLMSYTSKKGNRFKNIILDSLVSCGAEVYTLEIMTKRFIDILANKFNLNGITCEKWSNDIKKENNIKFPIIRPEHKRIASANLFLSMGIGKKALDLLRNINSNNLLFSANEDEGAKFNHLSLHNQLIFIKDEAFCELGLYKKANKIINKYKKHNLLDKLKYIHRKSNCYWLMGSFFRSLFYFKKIINYSKFIKNNEVINNYEDLLKYIDIEVCLSTIKFLLWYSDINKSIYSFMNLIINNKVVIETIQNLFENDSILRLLPYEKYHLVRILEDISEGIKIKNVPQWLLFKKSHKIHEVFAETDNILGVINYTRRNIEMKIKLNENVEIDDCLRLFNMSVLIDDSPGILKSALILKKYNLLEQHIKSIIKRSFLKVEWLYRKKLIWLINWHYMCFGKKYKRFI
jgi:tetratricopeptide (TPR) repeat protein